MSNKDERTSDLLLTELQNFEQKVSKSADTVWYNLTYIRGDSIVEHEGKLIEFGTLEDTSHSDLASLSSEGYTHFGIFRLTDRSTSTIVQSESGVLNKVFSFSTSDTKVSHVVKITPRDHRL